MTIDLMTGNSQVDHLKKIDEKLQKARTLGRDCAPITLTDAEGFALSALLRRGGTSAK